MVKKVITKKMTAENVGLPHGGLGLGDEGRSQKTNGKHGEESGHVPENEFRETIPDLPGAHPVAGRGSILADQIQASRKAHTPMNASINTLTVALTPIIQPGW